MDATTLEAQLVGVQASKVTVGMDAKYWLPVFAPDELLVDSKLLGHDTFELFDDGTHGDRISGDGVFARYGITTKMHPRNVDPQSAVTPRGAVTLGFIEAVSASGSTQRKQLGYTGAGVRSVFPGWFWMKFIEQSALRTVTKVGTDAQQTDNALNVVDAQMMSAIIQALAAGSEADSGALDQLEPLLERLQKTADFMYVYPARSGYGTAHGISMEFSSPDKGTGRPYNPPFPIDHGMRSLILLDHEKESPIHHETMHQWGAYLDSTLGFLETTHHWGTAGTLGVLGGFDATSLVDHGDGTYTVDRFEPGGGDWTTTPYGELESST